MSIRVSIVGATGYTGGELLRILVRHPDVQLMHVTSENYAGQPIHAIHKFLKGRLALECEKLNVASIANDSDVVFLGLPHGTAAKTAAALLDKGTRVIDLSADFRIKNLKTYEEWYGKHPVPKLLSEAVYGLPERYRDQIRSARLIANPGCYATTTILAGLPLFASKKLLGQGPIIADAKSGVSGAGRKLDNMYLYSEADESMQAYGLRGHRHHPEVWQEWKSAGATSTLATDFTFVPHLVPMNRGIFSTVYFPLSRAMTADALQKVYADYYRDEPFVTVLAPGESPEVKAVTYTNSCQIGLTIGPSKRQAIVMAVIDNLVKGASGQAVQNMNLMFGVDETTALL
jgi:N-acetyl-gamma-glutamyl-phosphate reductase